MRDDARVPSLRTVRRLLLPALSALAAGSIAAAPASATNIGVLDSQAATQGHVIEDASGTAYIAWTRKSPSGGAETPEFCKIARGAKCAAPLTLPIPGAAAATETATGAFPVFGTGSTVYVVAPRYVPNDVVLYTSTDGGASFGAGQVIPMAYSNKSNATEVFLSGGEFLVGGYNAGIGFSAFTAAGGLGGFSLSEPGPGGVAASALGLDSSGNPVEAYYNLNSPPYGIFFTRYTGAGSKTEEKDWTPATPVTSGYEPRLAGGAAGLLMVSEDYTSPSEKYASQVDVRKFTGTSFGPPLTLYNDAHAELFDGGAIAQSPAGHVAVVWPQYGGPTAVMRLFTSSNGGAGFGAPITVANLGSAYGDQVNAQVAVNDDGGGWLTFTDSSGLEYANLESGAGALPSAGTKATKIGSDVVTFAGPKGCVKPGQTITLKLSVASAKRKHKVVLKIYQVKFSVDGKTFKKLVRESVRKTGKVDPKPFVVKVAQAYTAGSTHTAAAQAFISEKHGKHASRTLRLKFTACS
jgi:hypothetical protein